ncbi:interleukin-1 receptor-associated kinase-like 2 isoform X2 [Eleutherodactylus coqui]|uniref:interleukin-1 receptor-associated kinase-like 2 isoform X2 n=1 Tax=Eleutherodactylus coqui TaxID=57060 RepID=UPI003462CB7A
MASSLSDSGAPTLIIDILPRVLDDFCRCIDSLNDWEWMRFASHVLNDQTSIQRFYMRRRSGDYVTRELLWSWGQQLATVQDLQFILQKLQLYRALNILQQSPYSLATTPVTDERREAPHDSGGAGRNCSNCNSVTEIVAGSIMQSLPLPPQPPSELLRSLSYSDQVSSTDQVLSTPQQEISLSLITTCQHWTRQQLEETTDGFSADRRIHSGQFSDVFLGQKGDNMYAVKRLKEMQQSDSFYEKEAQIGFRCHHPNLLKLLGFCADGGQCHLIYRFMKRGSLDVALQNAGSYILGWEKRLGIAVGLLQGVDHLHATGIFHGNIKSSNVFLDEDFTAKLGHPGSHFSPHRAANYTNMKTYELQRFQPYLPDSYLRSGLLTAQMDIFSCGVVLTELLTGQKPIDKDRDPPYLKDLILTEVEQVRLQAQSDGHRMESVDLLCASEISRKYADKRLERLGRSSAVHWASAICLCLTKKRALLSEVIKVLEKAQESITAALREPQEDMMFSVNIPEECDESLSLGSTQGEALPPHSISSKAAWSMNSVSDPGAIYSSAQNEGFKKSPCELDESGSFDLYPGHSWYRTESSSGGHQANSCAPEGDLTQRFSNSPTESNDPSWEIEINEAKMKLMEDIRLYADEKVDSSVLFDSA